MPAIIISFLRTNISIFYHTDVEGTRQIVKEPLSLSVLSFNRGSARIV